jgi:hypothetical protein
MHARCCASERVAPEDKGEWGIDAKFLAQQALVEQDVVVDGREWIVLRSAFFQSLGLNGDIMQAIIKQQHLQPSLPIICV